VNLGDPGDTAVSVGDWVQGSPGVSNSSSVRSAMAVLKALDITVPVWDVATGNGDNLRYRISGFARVRVMDYRLPGEERISVRFLGYAQCAG
jgi:hypothetical protein